MNFVVTGLIFVSVILLIGIALAREGFFDNKERVLKSRYDYRKKKSLVTNSELAFFKALLQAVGGEYQLFSQVHLSSLFDHEIRGQNWKGALSHIQRKSVDFVLCNKDTLAPLIAIELDDKSHERWDRFERDVIVEGIFKATGIPLLRMKSDDARDLVQLAQKIHEALSPNK